MHPGTAETTGAQVSRDYVALKAAHKAARGKGPKAGEAEGQAGDKAAGTAQAGSRATPIGMVVGLGNPGAEYEGTRHNVGAAAVDQLAAQMGASYWKTKPGALVAEVDWPHVFGAEVVLPNGARDTSAREGRATVLLVKPSTYMNDSGGCVAHLAREYHISPTGILVVHDDLEVEAGKVRVRLGGGHAGHNGLRSICDKLGTHDYGRVRTGIGRPPGRMAPADFVLKQTRGREAEELGFVACEAAAAALYAIEHGLTVACQRYA